MIREGRNVAIVYQSWVAREGRFGEPVRTVRALDEEGIEFFCRAARRNGARIVSVERTGEGIW